MPRTTYDTRFFIEHYYSKQQQTTESTRNEIRKEKEKEISTIVIHEVYRLTLQREGRDVAKLRTDLIRKDFKVISVDATIATTSAELRQKHNIPMADSIIAATALAHNATCVTDDPHITKLKEIDSRWI